MYKFLLWAFALFLSPNLFSQNLEWAQALSGSNNQRILGTAVDQNGNVYSTGEYWGVTDFDPGPAVLNLPYQGNADIFVQKYDANGALLWAIGLGSSGEDIGTAIDVDQNGNAYITGAFRATIDFDPGPGSFPLTTGGYSDIFVLKLDANGGFVWAKNFQSFSSFSTGKDIKVDATGNVYTTGKMVANVDFDPGPGTNTITAAGSDIFVHKLTANGDLDWVRTYGGSGQWVEEGQALEFDDQGNLYVSGIFMSTVDFDASFGTSNLTAAGAYPNVFIMKMKQDASFVWAKGFGSTSNLFPSGDDIAINGNDLYIVGEYAGTVDFDPGPGVQNYTHQGSGDIYIEKLDTAGNFQWVRSFGNQGIDAGISIATDYFSNTYVTGAFAGTVDFDPDPMATSELIGQGNLDAFVLKLDENGDLGWVFPLADNGLDQGNSIISDQFGTTIWTAGSFAGTVDFDWSGVTANLISAGLSDGFIQKISQVVSCIPTFAQLEPTICSGEIYTSPSGNFSWNQSGSYQDTITNTNGCDSILTIDLIVLAPINNQISVSICDGDTYQSPSGNYSWSQAGMYTDTLISALGCDSVLNIDLSLTLLDNSVSEQNNVLTANQIGAMYQWIDCVNNTPISGETSASYTPTSNGEYAVEITSQNCTVVSNCYPITTIGINEFQQFYSNAYPNPTSGQITLELPEASKELQFNVLNALGEFISEGIIFEETTIQLPKEKGVYFIHLFSKDREAVIRVVKE